MRRRTAVRRPTEAAALAAASRRPVAVLAPEELFERLALAHRAGDREGVCLLGHAIVRGSTAGRPS